MLQGCRKLTGVPDGRLPITKLILEKILSVSRTTISCVFSRVRFQAMCSLAFYALLRVGEMTSSDNNLSLKSVVFQDNYMSLNFKTYKHSSGDGASLRINALSSPDSCPMSLMQAYMGYRGSKASPLFLTTSGEAVPRQVFTSELKSALDFAGFDSKRYTSHSFRIGAASHMAETGASDAQIRQAGRWSSNAFLSYIRSNHSK